MKSTIALTTGGKAFQAQLYTPSTQPRGLVVVAYGSDGLTDDLSGPWKTMIEGYAQSLADKGFFAAIPDYLAVTATRPGPAVFDAMSRLRDAWQQTLAEAVDQCIVRTQVDARHVGLLGFSLGGHLALRARAKARVLVEFFAPILDGLGTPSAHPAHAQIHHGEADQVPGTGIENAAAVDRTLKSEGTATELFTYPGAGHGFIGNDEANRKARDLSKPRTLAFFDAHL